MIWSYWEKENMYRVFVIVCLYMFCLCYPIIKKRGNPINRFNAITWLCLSQASLCIPNAICRVFFYVQWVDERGGCSFYWYWWNWLPSLLGKRCEFESYSGEVYSIQHYVIKFVSDLRQVRGFLWVLRFPLPIKLTATI